MASILLLVQMDKTQGLRMTKGFVVCFTTDWQTRLSLSLCTFLKDAEIFTVVASISRLFSKLFFAILKMSSQLFFAVLVEIVQNATRECLNRKRCVGQDF